MLFRRQDASEFCPPGRDFGAAFDFLAVCETHFRRDGALPAALDGPSGPAVNPLLEARGSQHRRYRSKRSPVQAIDRRFAIPFQTLRFAAPIEFFRRTDWF